MAEEVKLLAGSKLVWWHPEKVDKDSANAPKVALLQQALAQNGFDIEYAEYVPFRSALSRVVKAMEGEDEDGSAFKASRLKIGDLVRYQLNKLVISEDDEEKIDSKFVSGWAFDKEEEELTPVGESGDIKEAVIDSTRQYEWGDVTKVIQNILKKEGNGAYPLRSGPPYCVPIVGTGDLMARLKLVADAIGLVVVEALFPDDGTGRAEVAEAIYLGLSNECDEHQKAIDGYSPEKTKAGVVDNRLEAINQTASLTQKLADQLGDNATKMAERISKIREKAQKAKGLIEGFKPTAKGRRMLFKGD